MIRPVTLADIDRCIDDAMRAKTDDELREAAERLQLDQRWPQYVQDQLELKRG